MEPRKGLVGEDVQTVMIEVGVNLWVQKCYQALERLLEIDNPDLVRAEA